MFDKWQILHKSKHGITRKVFFIDKKDSYLPEAVQWGLVGRLKNAVRWDLVDKFTHVDSMLDEIHNEQEVIEKEREQQWDNRCMDLCKEQEFGFAKALGTGRSRHYMKGA